MRLHIRLETLCTLISLAREFQAKEDVVIPEVPDNPTDDWAMQVLANHTDDSSLAEFRGIVEDMSERQRAELVALFWIGRGDMEPEEWDDAVQLAIDRDKGSTAEYLLSHPHLAEHWDDALDRIFDGSGVVEDGEY